MVLMVDDDCVILRGRLAVGPQTRVEAYSTWRYVDEVTNELRKKQQDVLSWLVESSLLFSANVRHGKERDSSLSLAVQQVAIPLTDQAGAAMKAFFGKTAITVSAQANDPVRGWLGPLADEDEEGRAGE